ncbi:Mitochondrial carrier protein (Partial), partial [Seminavis robusta]
PKERSGKGTNTVTSGPIAATTTATAVLEPSVDTTTALSDDKELANLGLTDLIFSLAELRGPFAPFQSADITFLASLVFGSFGFGATELFRRSFTEIFYNDAGGGSGGGSEVVLLLAAGLATVVTSAAATPFEVLRVKSMIRLDSVGWTEVLQTFLRENEKQAAKTAAKRVQRNEGGDSSGLEDINPKDLLPLWSGFAPTLSRELPFAIAKFLAFDVLARLITDVINSQTQEGALPVQVGVGPAGLAVSAIAGAVAGVAGAIVSHPADLILTYTSASKAQDDDDESGAEALNTSTPAWVSVVRDLLSRDGGIANLFLGLPARATFFFLVIGLQFFLYDYVKNLFQVGTDDLSLVLDVFYAVRAGLLDMD